MGKAGRSSGRRMRARPSLPAWRGHPRRIARFLMLSGLMPSRCAASAYVSQSPDMTGDILPDRTRDNAYRSRRTKSS